MLQVRDHGLEHTPHGVMTWGIRDREPCAIPTRELPHPMVCFKRVFCNLASGLERGLERGWLSGPVRDTPPYRAIPFRGGYRTLSPCFHRLSRNYRWDTPFLGGVSHLHLACSARGNAQKREQGYRTQLAVLRRQKPHSAQWGGISEIVSRYRAIRGPPLRGLGKGLGGGLGRGLERGWGRVGEGLAF